MDVGDAGLAERPQVAHAGAFGVGEREVLAAIHLRHAGVADREIAHVQFVDRHVGVRRQRGRTHGAFPPGRLQGCVVEVCDVTARRIRGEADRIRIGHPVADDADAGHEHIDQVGVVTATQVSRQPLQPDAGAVVARHRHNFSRRGLTVRVKAGTHVDCGRCPQAKPGCAVAGGGAQRRAVAVGRRVEIIQRARCLQVGGIQHAALRILLDQQHLSGQQLPYGGACRFRHSEIGTCRDEPEALRDASGRAVRADQRNRMLRAIDGPALLGAQAGGGGCNQAISRISRLLRPAHMRRVQPIGTRVGRPVLGGLQGGRGDTVAVQTGRLQGRGEQHRHGQPQATRQLHQSSVA